MKTGVQHGFTDAIETASTGKEVRQDERSDCAADRCGIGLGPWGPQ